MSPKKKTRKAMKTTPPASKRPKGFTEEERAAMRERAKELKAEGGDGSRTDGEKDVLSKIAEMGGSDRTIAQRVHAIVKATAPTLSPKTWYGMPAYAKEGKVICFFQCAQKFKARYATLGFSDGAKLDEGTMWPTSFALVDISPTVEARIVALLKMATG